MAGQQKALIIGGGIGGLAAAISLKQAGLEVAVYEQAPELKEVGAGLSLWANAVRALEHLGLAETVRAMAIPDSGGGIYSSEGELLLEMSNQELAGRFGDYSVMVHRAELHDLLLNALGRSQVHFGKRLVCLEQRLHRVRATFSDGSQAEGNLLVGADGLHSVVRAQLHGGAKPRYAGYTAWRAVVAFNHRRVTAGESWGRGARFGRVPMSRGRVYWFGTKSTLEGQRDPEGEKAALLRTFGSWHAPIRELIETAHESQILRNDIYDRPLLKRWGEGRVTLLGDAAHPMTPNLGQGACQALEDAVVLAHALRSEVNVSAALRAYEDARKARTDAIVLQSRRLGELGQWRHPIAVRLRNRLIRLLPGNLRARQLERILRFDT